MGAGACLVPAMKDKRWCAGWTMDDEVWPLISEQPSVVPGTTVRHTQTLPFWSFFHGGDLILAPGRLWRAVSLNGRPTWAFAFAPRCRHSDAPAPTKQNYRLSRPAISPAPVTTSRVQPVDVISRPDGMARDEGPGEACFVSL